MSIHFNFYHFQILECFPSLFQPFSLIYGLMDRMRDRPNRDAESADASKNLIIGNGLTSLHSLYSYYTLQNSRK